MHAKGGPFAHGPFGIAILLVAVTLLAGCGSGSGSSARAQSSRELALERAQLEQVASALRALEPLVHSEVQASRAAWPALADGLPRVLSGGLRATVTAAGTRALALPEPVFLAASSRLTGPAAGIAGIYENYEQLTQRGWQMTGEAVQTIAAAPRARGGPGGTAAQGAFERTNSPLYIDAIYDAHFDLSLLGKSVATGYNQLGGPEAFGAALTQAQVNALAAAYSIPRVRLEPHPAGVARDW